jgi:hypothetical protein
VKKLWRRYRMKYYFVFSLVLFVALILVNFFFLRRFFTGAG